MMSAQRSARPISRGMPQPARPASRGSRAHAADACREASHAADTARRPRRISNPSPAESRLAGLFGGRIARRCATSEKAAAEDLSGNAGRHLRTDSPTSITACAMRRDRGNTGASASSALTSAGAALALWRACVERGLAAWCYEFGFPRDPYSDALRSSRSTACCRCTTHTSI